ncbi:MAG: hypothetical protein ACKOXB_12805 [Flavobacteriales bacterium]
MNSEKEIDLYQSAIESAKVLLQKKWIILAFFVLGALYGFLKGITPSYYRTVFFAESPIVNNEVLKSVIAEREDDAFHRNLIIDADTLNVKVSIDTYEKLSFDTLCDGIRANLKNNPSIKKRHDDLIKKHNELLTLMNDTKLPPSVERYKTKQDAEYILAKTGNYCDFTLVVSNKPIGLAKSKTTNIIGFSLLLGLLGSIAIVTIHFLKKQKS